MSSTTDEQTKESNKARWRLVLGERASQALDVSQQSLSDKQQLIDSVLSQLYDTPMSSDAGQGGKRGGKGGSSINISTWLGDVRRLFPDEIVHMIQTDAIERKGLTQLIFEPEVLSQVVPDITLVSTLLNFKGQIPEKSKEAARALVKTVVDEIRKWLEQALKRAVTGALNRRAHSPIPHFASTDWKRTIQRNLKNYDSATRRLIPERFYFFERQQQQQAWHVILDIDQSGSMCESILYSSVMAAIFASMPALKTSVVAFDTNVVDLTELCQQDPVDILFGMQLGGGTDINRSVQYCQELIENPKRTLFILISDLYEGGVEAGLLRRLEQMKQDGVTVLTLLALSDSGRPAYDEVLGNKISRLGIPCFACAPKNLPALVGAAIKGQDLTRFADDAST